MSRLAQLRMFTIVFVGICSLACGWTLAQAQSLSIDVQVSKDKSSASSTSTTPTFSTTSANELLLAFVSSDAPTNAPNTIVTEVSGGGLTWQLVQRTNAQLGTAEIWRAFAKTTLTNASVTASLSQSVASSVTVLSFVGVDTSGINGSGAIGAVGSGNGGSGTPSASLVTSRNNSWVFGVGNDWDNAIARTPGTGQSLTHQYLATINDTYWVQQQNSSTAQSGTTVVINDTAPATDHYNLSIVEILPFQTPPYAGPLSIDAQVSSDKTSSSSNTTPLFSTGAANELLLAFISSDSTSAPNTTVTSVTGAGLTWQPVQRTNTQLGTAEIWSSFASSPLSNVAVNAALSQTVANSVTVLSFVGADPSGVNGSGAIGAVGTGNADPGVPAASLITTRNFSWVFGVGNDWDNAINRIPGPSQSLIHQYLAAVNDTYWVQALNYPTPQGGTTVSTNDLAPLTDRYNLSLVEVLPKFGTPPQITASLSPQANANGWNKSPVTATFQCTPGAAPIASCPAVQVVSTQGANQRIAGTVIDEAGLTGTANVTINIDETPPTITAAISPPPNSNGINTTSVTITFTCADTLSGVGACSSPINVTSIGSHQVFVGTALDNAGNTTTTSVVVNIQPATPTLVSIALLPATPSIPVGATQQFTAIGKYSDGSTQDLSGTAIWSSSDPGVAKISGSGLASAAAIGQTTIQASQGTVVATCSLVVGEGDFLLTGSLNSARHLHTATLLNNGNVLIVGGVQAGSGTVRTNEIYNATTGTFSLTGSLNVPRSQHTATLLNNGMVLIAGGYDASTNKIATAELYNPVTGAFTPTGSLNSARVGHTATLLNNGLVLIAGGIDSTFNLTASAELYDPASGRFSLTGNLNTARFQASATLLTNGMVLEAGGEDINGNALGSAELYDPSTGSFTTTGTLNTSRFNHAATVLGNATVLISGGEDVNGNALASAELYDPSTGSFTTTGTLNIARFSHTATLLSNGLVLVAGGQNASILASAELYVPATATFTSTGNMNVGHVLHAAARLNSGNVLISGGGFSLNTAELYEPTSNTAQGGSSGSGSTITSLTPTSGARGSIVTIAGSNFGSLQGTGTVTFAGLDSIVSSWNTSSIVATVPKMATSGNVVVTVAGSPSNGVNFTVLPQSSPTIAGITPNFGSVGSSITISGSGFGLSQSGSVVSFNGTAANAASWSDDSIVMLVPSGATSGNVTVTVGGATSNSVGFAVISRPLQITAPSDGTVVNPGQTFSVVVTSPSNTPITQVGVIGEGDLGDASGATSLPAQFSFTVPTDIASGLYMLSAVGATSAQQLVDSPTIQVDVERPDLPTTLSPQVSVLAFETPGEKMPSKILATFSDTSVLDVTQSTDVSYTTSDRTVATVDGTGVVTAIGPGSASITAIYKIAGQYVLSYITVTVAPPLVAPSPSSLTFSSQTVGTSSGPQVVTLTNVGSAPIKMLTLATFGSFSQTNNCLSGSALAPGDTCTISVTYTASIVGNDNGSIVFTNDANGVPISIPLVGAGVASSR